MAGSEIDTNARDCQGHLGNFTRVDPYMSLNPGPKLQTPQAATTLKNLVGLLNSPGLFIDLPPSQGHPLHLPGAATHPGLRVSRLPSNLGLKRVPFFT